MSLTPYEENLDKNPANYQPLTPLSFLARAAAIAPQHAAVIHANKKWTYQEFYGRCRQLGSALARRSIGHSDTVSVMLSNTPPMLEAHYGVPMVGAVLHSINTRLDPEIIAFQLDHANTKVVIVDREFAPVMGAALARVSVKPLVIDYDDSEFPQDNPTVGDIEYEQFLAQGDPAFAWRLPDDEWDAIALNYTSGTTGNPKGVVYHHRGATLMCYSNVLAGGMSKNPVYLWTLPMFHCNGWCFPWTLSAVMGTHVCLRWVRAKAMYDAFIDHGVTHLCGAPIVMSTLINADDIERRRLDRTIEFMTAAAPPPEAVLAAMAEAGFNVTHVYGLTETYGPSVVNEWRPEWNELSAEEQAAQKARQGVNYAALEELTVMDPATMQRVPADGETMGEVMMRGNIVMKGYLANHDATREAFAGGWFHSGDLGVTHPDGYIQLKDRSKDIIISGGENISSIEIEEVLYKHPSVAHCAVVAKPDEKWGETPMAYVELQQHRSASESEILMWCRKHLAGFKCPRAVDFVELPKTSTGKIQKFKLRQRAKLK
ncbi:MAG: acyl-CoA synthetase [Hyphomicrobiaceae bacterium]